MTLRETLAADLAATAFDTTAADTPAESVTYTAASGSPAAASVVAIFTEDEPARPQSVIDGETRIRNATCWITAAALTAAGIAPAAGDAITADSTQWTVQAFRQITGALWEIAVARTERREKSRGGYRIPSM